MTAPIIVRRTPGRFRRYEAEYCGQHLFGFPSADDAICSVRALLRFYRPAVVSAPALIYTSPIPK